MVRQAETLLAARKRMKMTQTEVAEKAGTTQSKYQRLEKGITSIGSCGFKTALAVCYVLGLDPYEFILGEK